MWNGAWFILLALSAGPSPGHADAQAARARWKELKERDCALAPKRCREADAAMRALDRSPGSGEALALAEQHLNSLESAAKRTRSTWPELMATRDSARAAGAPVRDPRGWTTAENILSAAAGKLEAGRSDAAIPQVREAGPLYDATRRNAMRVELVGAVDSAIARLDAAKARRFVPRSYVRTVDAERSAREILKAQDRLTPEVREAGRLALAEAKHAEYLLERIRAICEKQSPDPWESAVLDWEEAAGRAMRAAGLEVRPFETGMAPPLTQLEEEVGKLRTEHDRLQRDAARRTGDANTLQSRTQTLNDELRDRDLQLTELRRQVLGYTTLTRIQGMFTRDEGRVLIDDQDLVVRLHGLQFEAGKAEVPESAAPTLDKVVQAMKLLPGARVVVEGHTDSQGTPEKNMELSKQRAAAVRDWLATRAGVEAATITATGYGASRPVASNDSEGGRALNRRIEILIARPE